jgi:predicted nucleic acid-binding protein
MPFVIDNSVVCGWFIANQADEYTEAIAALLCKDKAFAPALLQLEFVNVLKTACKKGRVPIQTAREVVDQVCALPIEFDHDFPGSAAIMQLALRYDLTSYDAAYLELALRKQVPIATKDEALAVAAWEAGVGVLKG